LPITSSSDPSGKARQQSRSRPALIMLGPP
jgi:hypothetical protein